MGLKGLLDYVDIIERTSVSDGRGGSTATLTTIISSLQCSFQPIRREELRMELQGQIVVDPVLLVYETIPSGPKVKEGHIVKHGDEKLLVVSVNEVIGKGAHTETILKKVTGDAIVA